ncbi:MAG: aldehyde dehydrogenase, partial [Actinobacteria bacterium]|nr:aldehyde dehydrogenase [Actinomycetota bacterium]
TSLRLAELARAAGLPEGLFEVVTGGAETGAALVGDKAVGRVSFTGSTAVGRAIAESVAGSFKRITLELGGKSACVVFPDVDPVKVGAIAPGAAFGMAGQDCCARSRVILHEDVKDAFLESYVETMRAIRLGPPLDPDTEMGPLISTAHRDRVDGFVARSRAEGGVVLAGGEAPGGDLAAGSYYRPTVVDGVDAAAELAQAEVFGPVVAVMTFRTEEEAVRLANDTEFGLSGSIWTADVGRALRVSRAVRAGVLAVNSNTSVYPEAPFGGVGQSGLGRESGLAALEANTEMKTIFLSSDPVS